MSEIALHILNRGAATAAFPVIEITPMPLTEAAAWQAAIMAECRRRPMPSSAFTDWLRQSGLLSRCCFLASEEPGEPLCLHLVDEDAAEEGGHIWGCPSLDQNPDMDANIEYAHRIGLEYAGTIGTGDAVFNRVTVWGDGVPFTCSHLIYGWEESGRRVVLSAIDVHTLH